MEKKETPKRRSYAGGQTKPVCTRPGDGTKKRANKGRWTKEEHANFVRGYNQYGKDWIFIHEFFVTTRTETQIRTHAQKYLKKVEGGAEFPQESYLSEEDDYDSQTTCSAATEAAQPDGGASGGTNSKEAAAPHSSGP